MSKRSFSPCHCDETSEPFGRALKPVSTASQPLFEPKVTMRAPTLLASSRSISNQGLSALRMAAPPGSRPEKISALARATPSSPSGKFSVCTGPTVEMATAWGRTIPDRGRISSAWFMPISKMARRVALGMRARVRGTPMWLL